MSDAAEKAPNAANVRRRLRGSGSVPAAVVEPPAVEMPESPAVGRSSAMIPRPKLSGLIARPRLGSVDPKTRTPLPSEMSRQDTFGEELARLQAENRELRALIEQAISQEEENERQTREYRNLISRLEEQVELLKHGAGDSGDLVIQLQELTETNRLLNQQVQELQIHLQYAQENAGSAESFEPYIQAIQQRDDAMATLNARVNELEMQIANVPPPPPTDEELARMADELERERCLINQLRKELDDEKQQHAEDEAEMEKQMRDMEVQMSKERAEIARQRMELQRQQSEIHAGADSSTRNDANSIRDRLQQSQRAQNTDQGTNGGGNDRSQRDGGFMTRLFGKR